MPSFTNTKGLMIAIPHSGKRIVPEFMWSMLNSHPPMNFHVQYGSIKGHPVDEARNWLVDQAKAQGCKYLVFYDDDVTFPGHALRQMIFHMEHHPDWDVLGGIYVGKADWATPLVFRGNGHGSYWDWKVGELFEVSGIGMGCTIIRMSIFDKIEKPYFKTVDDIDDLLDGVNFSEMWTEDLYFCMKVTNAGGKIFADGSLLCAHWDDNGMPHMLPPESHPVRRLYMEKGKKKIVDLGCGKMKLTTDEGTVWGVDIRDDVGADYRCDLRCLPFGDGEFDIVHSSHTLEHFQRSEIRPVLKEWLRILKEGGEVRLQLPNIEWAAEQILTGAFLEDIQNNKDTLNVIYGEQDYDTNFHKACFTPKMITNILAEFGVEVTGIQTLHYNMMVTGILKNKKKRVSNRDADEPLLNNRALDDAGSFVPDKNVASLKEAAKKIVKDTKQRGRRGK